MTPYAPDLLPAAGRSSSNLRDRYGLDKIRAHHAIVVDCTTIDAWAGLAVWLIAVIICFCDSAECRWCS